jgi:hypothetical protein
MVTSCSALRASPGQWINQPTRHSSIPMLDPFAVHHPHHSTNGMGVSRRSCSCSCRTLKSCRQQRHLECRLLVTPCHAWIVAMPCRSRVLSASCRSRVLSASIWSRTTVALLTTLARARTSYIVAYLCLVAYPLSHCRTVALSHCRTVAYPLSPCGYIHIIMGSLRGHGLVQVAFQRPYLLEILLQSSLCIMEKSSRFLMRRPASRASIGRPIRICEPRWRLIPAHGCRYLLRFPRM